MGFAFNNLVQKLRKNSFFSHTILYMLLGKAVWDCFSYYRKKKKKQTCMSLYTQPWLLSSIATSTRLIIKLCDSFISRKTLQAEKTVQGKKSHIFFTILVHFPNASVPRESSQSSLPNCKNVLEKGSHLIQRVLFLSIIVMFQLWWKPC